MEWNIQGLNHYLLPKATVTENLESAIYLLDFDVKRNQFFLKRENNSFKLDYKIYDLDKKFIDRVSRTYAATNNNLGVLLHGIKGTGKSVTAKLICNALKLPVILVTKKYPGASTFFNNIHQDVVIFIDEYEKIYERGNNNTTGSDDLLSLMDGVLGTNGRKVFLLTSNSNTVNANMMQRPSRILYKKKYGNLKLESIIEVVDDILVHTNRREKVIDFISHLNLITIDIIKSVVREVNIHDEDPEEFEEFFNVEKVKISFSIYKVDVAGEEKLHRFDEPCGSFMPEDGFTDKWIGQYFYTRNTACREGMIIKLNTPFDIIVNPNHDDGDNWDDQCWGDGEDSEDDETDKAKKDNVRFVLKKTVGRHACFKSYYKGINNDGCGN